jgi:hypothetical protein
MRWSGHVEHIVEEDSVYNVLIRNMKESDHWEDLEGNVV